MQECNQTKLCGEKMYRKALLEVKNVAEMQRQFRRELQKNSSTICHICDILGADGTLSMMSTRNIPKDHRHKQRQIIEIEVIL